jgi:predicted RNase H-like nuclease (RuvC/YqgF family)
MPPNPTTVKKLTDEIAQFVKLCKELKAAKDKEICTPALRKKCASGQHGLKDNATNQQVREGLEERIDQLKRDLAKEQAKK